VKKTDLKPVSRTAKNERFDLNFADYSIKSRLTASTRNTSGGALRNKLTMHYSLLVWAATMLANGDWELRKSLDLGKPLMGVPLLVPGTLFPGICARLHAIIWEFPKLRTWTSRCRQYTSPSRGTPPFAAYQGSKLSATPSFTHSLACVSAHQANCERAWFNFFRNAPPMYSALTMLNGA